MFPDVKRHLTTAVGDGAAYLFSEGGVATLYGADVASLVAMLNGKRDLASLARARPGGLDAVQVASLIDQLVAAGIVTFRAAASVEDDTRALAYWDECGVDAETLRRAARVAVVAAGDGLDTAPVELALRETGLDVISNDVVGGAAPELTVVVCSDYLDPGLEAIDLAQRAAGRTWLLAKPDGARVWLGPFFQPGVTGCWTCLAHRLWGHRHAEACVQARLGRVGPAPRAASSVRAVTTMVSNLIAHEVTKWLAGHRYDGQRSVWTFDTMDMQGRRHPLTARPQCPGCGDPSLMARRAQQPVVLGPAPKVSSDGGGHRTMTPQQVLDRHRHLVSPVTGIIKDVTRDPRTPSFAHAYRSGTNLARNETDMEALRHALRAANGGKGLTAVEAEVGALCEAVERFSGTVQGDEHRVRGSLRSLGEQAVHPNTCMLFDERQFATRSHWNAEHSAFNHVPAPLDEDAVMDWTPVWSLTTGRPRLLPTAMLYYGAAAEPAVRADSNGCAAGSSLEDAVLQGALELIERDAVALWWYNRTRASEVDLASFGDPRITELRRRYASLGREMWVLDVTSDLGIPVMVAVSRRTGGERESIMFGFGAHVDAGTALRRAVSELNQLIPAVLDGAPTPSDPDSRRWLEHATVEDQPYLLPDPARRPRVPSDFAAAGRDDLRDDVEALVSLFAEHGMETLVLDQTRPDVELPVVKVIVPGLRSFWARYAPGRLFDVPVALGRLERPTEYHDLNPLPLFL